MVSSTDFYAPGLTLVAGAVLDLTGATSFVGLYSVYGNGEIDIRGNDQISATTFDGGQTLANFADSTFEGSMTVFPTPGNKIAITNEVGAIWTDEGETSANQFKSFIGFTTVATDANFFNYGTFDDLNVDGTQFSMNVVNDGLMGAGAWSYTGPSGRYGGFTFDDSLTGTGTIEIGLDHVTANALVGSSQTLEFVPAPSGANDPTLTLNDLQEFSGLITGFDQNGATNDEIVANTATWEYQGFVANSGGGSLVFSDGSADAYVDLSGSYQPNNFLSTVSGNQTTITYT
jgi:hypothetical protein